MVIVSSPSNEGTSPYTDHLTPLGPLFNPSYYFRHLNGKLMLFLSDAGEEVEKC